MNAKIISLISAITNIILSAAKLIAGFAFGSITLIASGIDSSLDIVSSLITFFGIKISEKPADKEHPYGHARYESLASYTVVMLIFASTLWIIYEAFIELFKGGYNVQYSIISIIVIIAAIIITEVLARLKYYFGNKFSSLSLVADAQHSRADVLSQIAVLTGLYITKYFSVADNILAILIAFYVLWSTYNLAKESVDSLVDKANNELEKKIDDWLKTNDYHFSDIKTRKIGSQNFAEIFLVLEKKLETEEITEYLRKLEHQILNSFNELTQVTLSIDSHNISDSSTRNWLGGRMHFRFANSNMKGTAISPKETDAYRIVIPYQDGKISSDFGSKEYMLIDRSSKKEGFKKEITANPFFDNGENSGHGVRFIKSVDADEIIVRSIGHGALNNLKSQNVKITILKKDISLDELEREKYETEKM
ncbi:MAG: cation diffusion facilitator family transporter [Patescibacteria group bacterium]